MQDLTRQRGYPWVACAGTVLAIAFLAYALLFWRLGDYPITDGDAGFYGRVARNILDTGEWGVLRFDPASLTSDVDKPPLGIWITALVFRVFGPTDVSARVWHSLVALGVLAMTAALAWRVSGKRAALVSSVALLTSAQFFYQAREPMLDVPLTACIIGTLWLLAGANPARFWPHYYVACLLIGVGMMIKGPLAAALVAAPVAMMAVRAFRDGRSSASRLALRLLLGVGLTLLVVLPWHLWVFIREGPPFIDMYAGTLSWRRYLEPHFPPGAAVVPYSLLGLAGLLPWAGFAIPALWLGWRERRVQPSLGMLSIFVAAVVGFFGLSPGRIIMRYVLPVIPACAVLIGTFLDRAGARALRAGALATITVGVALVPLGVWVGRMDAGPAGTASIVRLFLFLLAATMIAGGVILTQQRVRAGVAVLAGGAATAYLVLLVQATPVVAAMYPERALAGRVNAAEGKSARVAVFKPKSPEPMLSFYLDAPLERLATGDELARFLARPRSGWIIDRPESPLPPAVRRALDVVVPGERAALLKTKH